MPSSRHKSRSGSYVHEEQRSGCKVQFRLPDGPADELARRAEADGVSTNAYAARVVRESLERPLSTSQAARETSAERGDREYERMRDNDLRGR